MSNQSRKNLITSRLAQNSSSSSKVLKRRFLNRRLSLAALPQKFNLKTSPLTTDFKSKKKEKKMKTKMREKRA